MMDEATRLREFLEYIVKYEGKVCTEYEVCTHASCASSYAAMAFSSAALEGKTLESFLQEQAAVRAGLQGAIATSCVQCHTYMIQALPQGPIRCPACFSHHVRLEPVERMPNGKINNCTLEVGYSEEECQMCPRACPDKALFTKLPPKRT